MRDRLCDETGKLRRHFNLHVNGGEDVRLLQGLDTLPGWPDCRRTTVETTVARSSTNRYVRDVRPENLPDDSRGNGTSYPPALLEDDACCIAVELWLWEAAIVEEEELLP